MKILWHSVAPWVPSGYGQQTAAFTPRIRALGHDVAISAYWGLAGSMLGWNGMDVYPSDNEAGNRLLPTYALMHDADLVITLLDVWVLQPQALKVLPHMACWLPEDHAPLKPRHLEFMEATGAKPIAMSRFGSRMLKEAGLDDSLYVPHGIDTKLFRPLPELREATRQRMGLPEDAFVVGMVAANKGRTPSRKAFPEVMQAFSQFHREHPDAVLYLHTDPSTTDQGVPLGRLIEKCGVPPEVVHFTKPVNVELGVPPEGMAAMYSAFDVLASPSYGEGFGIPIIEAQASGCPVIVTDFSAMTELCDSGWLVECDPWYDAQHGSFFGRPRPESIAERLEQAYEARGDQAVRRSARQFALRYDADRMTELFWKPALAKLTPREASRIVLPERPVVQV